MSFLLLRAAALPKGHRCDSGYQRSHLSDRGQGLRTFRAEGLGSVEAWKMMLFGYRSNDHVVFEHEPVLYDYNEVPCPVYQRTFAESFAKADPDLFSEVQTDALVR